MIYDILKEIDIYDRYSNTYYMFAAFGMPYNTYITPN